MEDMVREMRDSHQVGRVSMTQKLSFVIRKRRLQVLRREKCDVAMTTGGYDRGRHMTWEAAFRNK